MRTLPEEYRKAHGLENGGKLKNRTIPRIIKEAEDQFELPSGSISEDTLRKRFARNNPSGKGNAHVSPVDELEPVIIDFCVKLARMGSPLGKEQVITLANDLLKGTGVEDPLFAYKKKHTSATNDTAGRVGVGLREFHASPGK